MKTYLIEDEADRPKIAMLLMIQIKYEDNALRGEFVVLYLHFKDKIKIDSFEFLIEENFVEVMQESWFDDPLIQQAVRDVDLNTTYYGKFRWESPALGVIGAEQLSGGIKTIIAAYFMPDKIFPLDWLGDNCAKVLHYLSENHDLHFAAGGYLLNFEYGHMIKTDLFEDVINGYYIMNELIERGVYDETEHDIFY